MAGRINPELLARLGKKLRVGQSRAYALIDAKARETLLPRHLAAVALASERGINISRYADEQDLATIRGAGRGAPTPSVSLPLAAPEKVVGAKASVTRGKPSKAKKKVAATPRRRGNTVFVVHGRDLAIRDAMFSFLRSISLKPLEWTQAIRMTGQASPYVGVILDTAFREAAAVVVLMTPDDEAKLKGTFVTTGDPAYEKKLTGQARPNVLFEAGMAFGRNPENTVLVQVGTLRPFSDVGGRHVVNMTNSAPKRAELVTKLANAGCNVDTTGTDWYTTGDFDIK
jgi:predicted nucleotide-binding protein